MIDAKDVTWQNLHEFADTLAEKGFKPDRDLTELELRMDLVTVKIYIDRKSKGEFKQIRAYIRANFVDFGACGIQRTFDIKPFKGLSAIYVDECLAAAQNMQTAFRDAFSAAASQAALIDPKAILKQETNHG